MKKKRNWQRIISAFVMLSLILAIVYVVFAIIQAPSTAEPHAPFERVKSDYALMLLQCILGVCAMLMPGLLAHRVKIQIPSRMLIFYTIFLYCAIYLGEVRSFYYHVPHWDTVLHTFSGAMLAALGFSVITLLDKTERIPMIMSPLFVAIFTFCFAVTLGVFWEIYEYTADGLLRMNMQKFALEDGTQLVGHAALGDTMKDLIVDCLGAFAVSVGGYISLRYQKGWIEKVQLKQGSGRS